MKDTTKIVDAIVKPTDSTDYLDLLEKVHSFYDSAWDKLLIVGSLIGIVIPILYALYQRRLYNISKKELLEEVKSEIAQLKTELNENIKLELQSKVNEMNSKFHDIETRFDKKIIALDGATFHLQGTDNLNRNQYSLALTDYCVAADKYLKGDDYLNFNIVMQLTYQHCIPKMKYSQIKKLIDTKAINIDALISLIQTHNQKNVFTSHINGLRQAIEDSKSGDLLSK